MTFWEVVQEELDARGWSQMELVRRSGLQQSYVNRGLVPSRSFVPSIDKAVMIARAFDLPLQYFVDRMEVRS